jgi:hypothetical protein
LTIITTALFHLLAFLRGVYERNYTYISCSLNSYLELEPWMREEEIVLYYLMLMSDAFKQRDRERKKRRSRM